MTNKELSANFAINLEKERIELSYTQSEMAKLLGISLSTYKNILNGTTSKLPIHFGKVLYDITGKLLFEFCGDEIPEFNYLKKFRQLPEHRKKIILTLLETECDLSFTEKENQHFSENPTEADNICVFVPLGNVEDGMIYNASNIETINIKKYKNIYGNEINCGIKIMSNHLHPIYHTNDILLISRRPPRDGDTAIFINKYTSRVYIRRFRQTIPCRLEPLGNYGEVITVDSNDITDMEQWVKFGVVLTKIR